jgi:hypothetical protein
VSTLFPIPVPPDDKGPCAWCGKPAIERVVVTPAVFTAAGGVRRMKTRATEADVCAEHAAMVARNKDEAEAEKLRNRRAPR